MPRLASITIKVENKNKEFIEIRVMLVYIIKKKIISIISSKSISTIIV
jgi:hypothetical protein